MLAHPDTFAEASAALTENVVVVSEAALTAMRNCPVGPATPLAIAVPWQPAPANAATVAPGSAVPVSAGSSRVEGERGSVPSALGTGGAVLSSTYATEVVEHAEVLPAPSRAVA